MLKKFFVLTIFIGMHNVLIASQNTTAQIQLTKEITKYSFEGFEFGDHLSTEDNNDNLRGLIEKRKTNLSMPCCNHTFSWPDFLNHFKNNHESKNNHYDCPYENCTKTFNRHQSARNHYITHWALNLFTCACCNEPHKTQSNLKRHFWNCIKKFGLTKKNNNPPNQEITGTEFEHNEASSNQDAVNRLFLEGHEFGDHISPKQHDFNFQSLMAARRRKITIPYKNNMLSWAAFRKSYTEDNAHKRTLPCINNNCLAAHTNIYSAMKHHAEEHNQDLFDCPHCQRRHSCIARLKKHFRKCIKNADFQKHQSNEKTDTLNDSQDIRIDLGAIINESIDELEHISRSNTNIM